MGMIAKVYDGWVNLFTNLGVSGKDKRTGAQAYWQRLEESEAETIYAGDDMAAKIVDTLPEDALRQWVTFSGMDPELVSKVSSKIDQLKLKEKLDDALKLSRIYGGSGILLLTAKSDDYMTPLDQNNIQQITGMIVFSRWELVSNEIDQDVFSPNYSLPLYYSLNPRIGFTGNLKVHHSRIIRFDGVKLPRKLYVENNYWGDSVLTRIKETIRDYKTANDSAVAVLADFSIGVWKIKGLADLIANGQEDLIRKRIEIANMSKSIIRSIVLDPEEDFEDKARTITGVPEMLSKVDNRMVSASKMPHTKLLGESPSGLGATGNSELRDWYDQVKSYQELKVAPALNIIFPAIIKEVNGGKLPEKWSYNFVPLMQETQSETVDLRLKQAQSDAIYIDRNVVSSQEIAASRFGGEEYSIETKLVNDQPINQPVDKLDASTEVQSLIFEKGSFANAEAAKKWASEHNFNSNKVDETGESFRLRQVDPSEFDENTLRTIEFKPGVKAVIGIRK